jgi:hypothetical protein
MPLRATISLEETITDGDATRLLELRRACEDLCARLDIGGSDGSGGGFGQVDVALELSDRYPVTDAGEALAQEAIYTACEAAFLALGYKLPKRGDELTVNVQAVTNDDETPLLVEQPEPAVAEVTLITRWPTLSHFELEALEAVAARLGATVEDEGAEHYFTAHTEASFAVTLAAERFRGMTPPEVSEAVLADLCRLLGEDALAAQTGWVLEARVDVPHAPESEADGE